MTNLELVFSADAELEILHAYFWYENEKKGLGEEFKIIIDSKIKQIQYNPKAYSFIYRDICSSRLKKFPYYILYRIIDLQIQVIAIFHHSRNPRQWKRRMQ